MSGDRLWDPRAGRDGEVERLERLLGRYRWRPEPLAVPRRSRPVWIAALAAAAVVVALLAVRSLAGGASYRVEGLAGVERVRPGERIATGAGERARVEIGELGEVVVGAASELVVVDCGERAHRLHLERGRMSARIDAVPRLFQVGTPAGSAIDLGCRYELEVDGEGRARLAVEVGEVAFEHGAREVLVPAGASVVSEVVGGPGVPVFGDAEARFVELVREVERAAEVSVEALGELVERARYEDTLTLWHLYDDPRSAAALREACLGVLVRRFPLPQGVTVEEIEQGNRGARAAWRAVMEPAWRTAN